MRRITILSLCAALAPSLAGDQPVPRFTDPERRSKLAAAFPEIEKLFEDYRRERRIPGLVFGVVIDGEPALIRCLGVRNRESNGPVTPDTVFRIASMTKSFTAAAVLKLRDEGKLSLDDPVSRWIPEAGRLRYPTGDTAPLRVRQLLTHSCGFPEDNPWGDRQLDASDAALTSWLKAGIPFSTPPGTAYEYSNYGFALAGRVISKASGTSYREYLEKRILAPLGMTASTLEPAAVPSSALATGYERREGEYFVIPMLGHGSFGAMGGLLTSARDLARYVAWQLDAWPPRGGEDGGPLRRSSRREMQQAWQAVGLTATRSAPGGELRAAAAGYGYGLAVNRDCRFDHIVRHGGGLPGFGSHMMWLPEYGVGMFAMANLTYSGPSAPMERAFDALRRTGGLQPRRLPPSPALLSARDAIARLWQRWDDVEAKQIAADDLFQDRSAGDRRKEVERLREELGSCRAEDTLEPGNLLRGRFRMTCDRGFADVSFTLAPTMPPKVQFLEFTMARRPGEDMARAAATVASLAGSFSRDRLAAAASPSLDQEALARSLAAVGAHYGACRVAETVSGDGRRAGRFRLHCDRASLDVLLRLDEQGRLREAAFPMPAGDRCAP